MIKPPAVHLRDVSQEGASSQAWLLRALDRLGCDQTVLVQELARIHAFDTFWR